MNLINACHSCIFWYTRPSQYGDCSRNIWPYDRRYGDGTQPYPTTLLVGSGLAAKLGMLPQGSSEEFQEAAQLDVIMFDKTETLTEEGKPCVMDVEVWLRSIMMHEVVLGIMAKVESVSTHPLAAVI